MSSLDELPAELAELYRAALPTWSVYSSIPGAASLPAIVVGRPDRVVPYRTGTLWQVELPVYVLVSSVSTDDQQSALLQAGVELVGVINANRTGTTFVSARVVELREFYDVQVGASNALACSVSIELMIPDPTQ